MVLSCVQRDRLLSAKPDIGHLTGDHGGLEVDKKNSTMTSLSRPSVDLPAKRSRAAPSGGTQVGSSWREEENSGHQN